MAKAATKAKSTEKAAPAKPAKQKWDSSKLHTVTPHLVCSSAAKAIDFYKEAFGAEEVMRLAGPDGSLWHACVTIGDSAVMLVDEFPGMGSVGPKALKGTPVTIHLNVPNVDAVVEQAVAAGAKVIMPVSDMFWGDRYGIVEDPFGHKWSVSTQVRAMTVEEIKAAMPASSDCDDTAA
ncbi:VOC family protein [Hyphomicrobium sp.]|uniref:VOC family protein n=1 Tax=Hyphomicrobium sp. TaxID=82 RepID=UPI002E320921|nr:VOC family protein [Hyphomicrobium sp.]HEX2841155.1 VOC family protein [Hyphomicrobium sp.]